MINKKDKFMIMVLMLAGFAGSLSQNLLTSALPAIINDLKINAVSGQWLTTSYILILGIITAISAWIFFCIPTRKLELISLSLFTIGCLGAILAPNFSILLFMHIIQACGAGILIPLMQMVVLELYPMEKQGQAMSLTGIIVGFAPALGPTISGILTDHWGWRSIFVLLSALGIFCLLISLVTLRNVGNLNVLPLDWKSLLLYSLGFITLMLGVDGLSNSLSLSSFVLIAISLIILWIFCYIQLNHPHPLLKIKLLKNRAMASGTGLLGLAYVLMMAGTILVPLYIQTMCHYSATVSGLILFPGSLLIALLSPLSGRLTDQIGAQKVCLSGIIILAIGCLCFVFCNETSSIFWIVLSYTLRSIGLAFLITPCSTLAVQEIPAEDKANATAIVNSFRQMCGALFSTVLVMISTLASKGNSLDMIGIHTSFIWMFLIAVIGIVISIFLIPKKISLR